MSEFAQSPAPPRPVVTPPHPFELPQGKTHRLGNGLRVVHHHVPGQYVVSARLAVPAPLDREPRAVEGVAAVVARTMDEGTADRTADEMAEAQEATGAAYTALAAERGIVVDIDVPSRHLDEAMELMAECVMRPAFHESEIARYVRTRLARLNHERYTPGIRAGREFMAAHVGAQDRFSRPAGGLAETVQAITRGDVVEFYERWMVPDGAQLVIAGDTQGLDPFALAERVWGGWQASGRDIPALPGLREPRAADGAPRIIVIDRPSAVQTEMYLGCDGPARRVPGGWAPFQVLSYLIGGSPSSRLDTVLREEKGYTYGIRSLFRARSSSGMFTVSGSVRSEVTAPALAETLSILQTVGGSLTTSDVADAARGLMGTAPSRYATADVLADEVAALGLEGLDLGWAGETLRHMGEVTVDECVDAWQSWVGDGDALWQRRWTITLVGSAEQVAEPVKALGWGDVEVVPE